MLNTLCLHPTKKISKQQGFHVPMVLVFLVVILLSAGQLVRSVSSTQKEINADINILRANLAAQTALQEAERLIEDTKQLPTLYSSLLEDNKSASLIENFAWSPYLDNYALTVANDRFTNQQLYWWDQGDIWWKKYANHGVIEPKSFFVVEVINELKFSDYGQDDHYRGEAQRVLYRITARGESIANSKSLKQTHYVKIYYPE